MPFARTGKHGTISHGNVSIKGTLMGWSSGFNDDTLTVEVDNGGGEVDFPAHWVWTEDKPTNQEIFGSLPLGGAFRLRSAVSNKDFGLRIKVSADRYVVPSELTTYGNNRLATYPARDMGETNVTRIEVNPFAQ